MSLVVRWPSAVYLSAYLYLTEQSIYHIIQLGEDRDGTPTISRMFRSPNTRKISPELGQTDSPAAVRLSGFHKFCTGLSHYRKCASFHSETQQSEVPNSNRSIRLCNFGEAWRGVGRVVTLLRFLRFRFGSGVFWENRFSHETIFPWGHKPNSTRKNTFGFH